MHTSAGENHVAAGRTHPGIRWRRPDRGSRMTIALWLLAIQGGIGAFDTLYYHEWKARLPARGRKAASELKLHAARDLFYGVLFGTLPWLAWQGTWILVL